MTPVLFSTESIGRSHSTISQAAEPCPRTRSLIRSSPSHHLSHALMRPRCATGYRRVDRRVDHVGAGQHLRDGLDGGRRLGGEVRRRRRRGWRAPSTPSRTQSSSPSRPYSPTAALVAVVAAEAASACGRAASTPHEAGAPLARGGGGLVHAGARPRATLPRPSVRSGRVWWRPRRRQPLVAADGLACGYVPYGTAVQWRYLGGGTDGRCMRCVRTAPHGSAGHHTIAKPAMYGGCMVMYGGCR